MTVHTMAATMAANSFEAVDGAGEVTLPTLGAMQRFIPDSGVGYFFILVYLVIYNATATIVLIIVLICCCCASSRVTTRAARLRDQAELQETHEPHDNLHQSQERRDNMQQ